MTPSRQDMYLIKNLSKGAEKRIKIDLMHSYLLSVQFVLREQNKECSVGSI